LRVHYNKRTQRFAEIGELSRSLCKLPSLGSTILETLLEVKFF
jgi:hypothetical protein